MHDPRRSLTSFQEKINDQTKSPICAVAILIDGAVNANTYASSASALVGVVVNVVLVVVPVPVVVLIVDSLSDAANSGAVVIGHTHAFRVPLQ
ncbi:hypothetical protein [Paraburkholderia solisilvae]|uniref:hypothetical protein n=1 Tax=Paraburkholderia solisilvae TaxID=624376 RepID=UPI001581A8DD|nr:hypothetical protein [Paraburkholderia solisilvae]